MDKNDIVMKEALRRDRILQGRGFGRVTVRTLAQRAATAPATKTGYFYRMATVAELDEKKELLAVRMLERCQRKLKIPKLQLAWYRLCGAGERGSAYLGPSPITAFVILSAVPKIWIRADLSIADAQLAAAHEAHHIWMESQPPSRYASLGQADRENCATAFALIMWQEARDEERKREERRG